MANLYLNQNHASVAVELVKAGIMRKYEARRWLGIDVWSQEAQKPTPEPDQSDKDESSVEGVEFCYQPKGTK